MIKKIIPIFIPHIGCPKDCVFCNQKRISGSLLPAKKQDVTKQVNEGLLRLSEGEKPQIAFYGGSFTAMPESEQIPLLEAGFEFVKSGKIDSIRLSTRPDAIDEITLERLKNFGVKTIELGSQSMDETVLKMTNRGHTAEDTVRASALISGGGFELILQMMTGLPASNFKKDLETARKIANLNPSGVRVYPTVIVRDTELFDMFERGEYREHTVEEAVAICAEISAIFAEKNVPIIRMGLNPTDDLSSGTAVGGAYHPAFGELVLSRVFLNKIRPQLELFRGCEELEICVHKSRVSVMVGQGRSNIEVIVREYGVKKVKILGKNPKKDGITVQALQN